MDAPWLFAYADESFPHRFASDEVNVRELRYGVPALVVERAERRFAAVNVSHRNARHCRRQDSRQHFMPVAENQHHIVLFPQPT